MDLIKRLNQHKPQLAEDAAGGATGGGAIASASMPLFASLVKRTQSPALPVVTLSPLAKKSKKKKKGLGIAEAMDVLREEDASAPDLRDANAAHKSFDDSQVLAKLKGLEKKNEVDRGDTVTFGLEDDNGGLVRVAVKSEQANDFERALQSLLANVDDDTGQTPEIAEILFKLKDHFDIVDVSWPEVQEDEEQQQSLEQDDIGDVGEELPADDMGELDAEMPADPGVESVQGLLQQVIDMMKADAEARKAEALAREAEAKTKQAAAIADQTMARVRQEEEYLDMEAHEKARKEEEKEAKRLARLARWKHETSQGSAGQSLSTPDLSDFSQEDEERARPPVSRPNTQSKTRVAPVDIAQFIINRVR